MNEDADCVVFEQPLNERVRSLLRLEFLFDQYAHHRADQSLWGNRAALHTLLDILSVIGRSDLKTDLVKDLGEQYQTLRALADHPDIDARRLRETLDDLRTTIHRLQSTLSNYPAAVLRQSDLLAAVLNRFAIPGGTCGFDLPSYHRWLSRPHAEVVGDLDRWYGQLGPLERAIRTFLRLLRLSTESSEQSAEHGMFLYTPQAHYQMIRVLVPTGLDVYPETSANRHRFSIRFMRLGDVDSRSTQVHETIPFRLQCCTPPTPA